MKQLRQSFKGFHSDDLVKVVYGVAHLARNKGIQVTTSDIIVALQLLEIYSALKGELDYSDIELILTSVYAKRQGQDEIIKGVIRNFTHKLESSNLKSFLNNVLKDLRILGVSFGDKLRKQDIFKKHSKLKKEAYARLKFLGFISRDKRGERIVDLRQAELIAKMLSKEFSSYNEAFRRKLSSSSRAALEAYNYLGPSIIDYIDKDTVSVETLMNLYSLIQNKNYRNRRSLLSRIARLMAEKIKADENIKDAEMLYSILSKENLIKEDIASKLLMAEPRLAERIVSDYDVDRTFTAIKQFAYTSPKKSIRAISSMLKRLGADTRASEELFFSLGKGDIYSKLVNGFSKERSKLLGILSVIRTNILRYFLEDYKSYLEYASIELAKLEDKLLSGVEDSYLEDYVRDELKVLKKIIEEAQAGNIFSSLRIIIKNMDVYSAFTFLSSLRSSSNKKIRSYALMLMKILLRKSTVTRSATLSRSPRKKIVGARSRHMDVRLSLSKMLRLESQFIVSRIRRAPRRIVLVVDKSGSMKPYALQTMLLSSSLIPIIRRLVLFDQDVYVYEKRSINRIGYIRLIDRLLSTRFSGYTNVTYALKIATKDLSPAELILVSDLQQTVISKDSVKDVICSLSSKGWNIKIVTPPVPGRELVEGIKQCGKIFVVDDYRKLPRVLNRIIR